MKLTLYFIVVSKSCLAGKSCHELENHFQCFSTFCLDISVVPKEVSILVPGLPISAFLLGLCIAPIPAILVGIEPGYSSVSELRTTWYISYKTVFLDMLELLLVVQHRLASREEGDPVRGLVIFGGLDSM